MCIVYIYSQKSYKQGFILYSVIKLHENPTLLIDIIYIYMQKGNVTWLITDNVRGFFTFYILTNIVLPYATY